MARGRPEWNFIQDSFLVTRVALVGAGVVGTSLSFVFAQAASRSPLTTPVPVRAARTRPPIRAGQTPAKRYKHEKTELQCESGLLARTGARRQECEAEHVAAVGCRRRWLHGRFRPCKHVQRNGLSTIRSATITRRRNPPTTPLAMRSTNRRYFQNNHQSSMVRPAGCPAHLNFSRLTILSVRVSTNSSSVDT